MTKKIKRFEQESLEVAQERVRNAVIGEIGLTTWAPFTEKLIEVKSEVVDGISYYIEIVEPASIDEFQMYWENFFSGEEEDEDETEEERRDRLELQEADYVARLRRHQSWLDGVDKVELEEQD